MKAFDHIADEWNQYRNRPIGALNVFLPKWKGNEVVLDAGCGNGRNLIPIIKKCRRAYGVDSSRNMLAHAKNNLKKAGVRAILKHADIRKLPFVDERFDVIFCMAVLHHMPPKQMRKALKEMHRVLRPGGRLYASVWSFRHPKAKKYHVKEGKIPWKPHGRITGRRYHYFLTKTEWQDIVKRSGFNKAHLFFERKGRRVRYPLAYNMCLEAEKHH
ncbi:class I SAM-dependent methyltransferase [Candidatus Micrarchaeota archaeon]|nr:class I SAM-dependent methyltransferase [Candidatus Micrarchaeota archaeon]